MTMTIRTVYHGAAPSFPATDQHPSAMRYGPFTIGGAFYWADAVGGTPSSDDIAAVIAPAIPTITKAQALLWLLTINKTDADVEIAIATISDATARAQAQIQWRHREPFHRSHPLFDTLGAVLGLDTAELDAAFRAAALL